MKRYLIYILAIPLLFIGFSFALVNLYTEAQIEKIEKNVIENYYLPYEYTWDSQTESVVKVNDEIVPIYLSDILVVNIPALAPESENDEDGWSNGEETPYEYKVGWRQTVCNNPSLLFAAWDLYGKNSIRKLNSRLGYKAEHLDPETAAYWEGFTTQKFWDAEIILLGKYNTLIDKLLMLNDNDLNYYVKNNKPFDDETSYEFQNWLEDNNITGKGRVDYLNPRCNNFRNFPGDLLCLTSRVCEDYPTTWTPRKFLTEAKKFAKNVSTSIVEFKNK